MSLNIIYDQEKNVFRVLGREFYDIDEASEYLTSKVNKFSSEYEDFVEQRKRDQLSEEYNRRQNPQGRGVVNLNVPDGRYVYDSPRSGVQDLYAKQARGDKEAKRLLDRLWDLSLPRLREIEREGINKIFACPSCGAAITDKSEYCEVCGVALSTEYKRKGIDI